MAEAVTQSYPVFADPGASKPGVPNMDARLDTRLPNVRQRLVSSAHAAIRLNMPILPDARDVLREDDPRLAEELGFIGGAVTERIVAVPGLTLEEYRLEFAERPIPGEEGDVLHSGTRGATRVSVDYNGRLGGGTPKNPFRIGGVSKRS